MPKKGSRVTPSKKKTHPPPKSNVVTPSKPKSPAKPTMSGPTHFGYAASARLIPENPLVGNVPNPPIVEQSLEDRVLSFQEGFLM